MPLCTNIVLKVPPSKYFVCEWKSLGRPWLPLHISLQQNIWSIFRARNAFSGVVYLDDARSKWLTCEPNFDQHHLAREPPYHHVQVGYFACRPGYRCSQFHTTPIDHTTAVCPHSHLKRASSSFFVKPSPFSRPTGTCSKSNMQWKQLRRVHVPYDLPISFPVAFRSYTYYA